MEYQNSLQDKRLSNIEKHIEVINSELGSVKTDVAQIRTDVNWLKRFSWIVITALVGSLIATLFSLMK